MPHIAKTEIIIIWEHELIEAAKALGKVLGEKATAEDFSNALKACLAAIYSPKLASGKYPITIMSAQRVLGSSNIEETKSTTDKEEGDEDY